jgi:RNA polymerase sigma-70 factor (ECF subfamily)
MREQDLRDLTQAAARGDRAAIDELVEHYLPELRAFVRLRLGAALRQREAHSDIVQSACREALERAESFRHAGAAAFRKWLFTMALRKIGKRMRHHRAQKRDVAREAPRAIHSDADDARVVDCYHTFSSPSERAVAREEMERVEAAFEQLSEEQREVVTLAHIVGLSRAEIAAQIGSTEGAVRVTLHRALAKLSRLLA